MGLVIVGLMWVANRPLGALGGYIDAHVWMRRPTAASGWRALFLVGVVLGGTSYALASSQSFGGSSYTDLLARLPSWARPLSLAGAGVFIGYGARRAGGCTSGHGLCGTSLGSPASMVSTMTFMMTAVAAAHLLLWIGGAL